MDSKGKQWSSEDIDFLKKNYEAMKFKDLSESLERSIESIRSKLKRMGLSKEAKAQTLQLFTCRLQADNHAASTIATLLSSPNS